MHPVLRKWLREPLVHFLVIAGLIFAIDQAVRSDANDPLVIVVDDTVRSELVKLFEEGQGRTPNDAEMEVLIDRWLYDEIMYREAVALGLDKGDDMFRSRLELKLRTMLIDTAAVEPPTEAQLRAWFEANRDQFRAPRRFDFAQFQVDGAGEGAGQAAAALAESLVDTTLPDPYDDQVQFYKNRSRDNIAATFGESFAAGLLDGNSANNGWRPVRSDAGWHVARIVADKEPFEASFDSLRPRLEAEWTRAETKRLAAAAFAEIRERYDVRREDSR